MYARTLNSVQYRNDQLSTKIKNNIAYIEQFLVTRRPPSYDTGGGPGWGGGGGGGAIFS